MRYLFDLTTTAQWQGAAVGISRVEQELAKRARHHLGEDVAFCLYDNSHAAVRLLDDTTADDFIEGRARIEFTARQTAAPGAQASMRSRLRAALLRNATAYHLYQRLRGRSFTREQILQIQALEVPREQRDQPIKDATAASHSVQVKQMQLARLQQARLDADTTIISGGFDWRYKNLRALWRLKQVYRFSYCAIVYDLIPIRFPHFVIPGYVEQITEYFGELLWLADKAMCISEATREDWLRHAHEVGTSPVPSVVFPLGCDPTPSYACKSTAGLPLELAGKRFALYVSTIEPRKNHRLLYEAWDECLRTKQVDPARDRIVFVGRRGWAMDDLMREIATNPLTRDTIVLLHDVSDAQLSTLYQTSAFVLFPSLYEGFGLPLAEALGHRKLCISSDAGSLPEIGGELVMRLSAKDPLSWSHAISRLMKAPAEIEEWEMRVKKSYHSITWDEAANSFFDALKMR